MTGRSDAEQAREIARDIAIELIRKSGVQEWQDGQTFKEIRKRAIEMASGIIQGIPEKR